MDTGWIAALANGILVSPRVVRRPVVPVTPVVERPVLVAAARVLLADDVAAGLGSLMRFVPSRRP
jgi:hypothetical protein